MDDLKKYKVVWLFEGEDEIRDFVLEAHDETEAINEVHKMIKNIQQIIKYDGEYHFFLHRI